MFGLWEYKESNGSQKEESLQNTHQLVINWEGLYPNTVPDLDAPFNVDYYYYTDDILQNSLYTTSSYACPFCESEEEDGVPVFPVLMKLKIQRTVSIYQGDFYTLFNIFTCPKCRRFFVSIKKKNGNDIRNEDYLPPALRELALISAPYEQEIWRMLLENTAQFTNNPAISSYKLNEPKIFLEDEDN